MGRRLLLNLVLVAVIAVLATLAYFKPGVKKPAPAVPLTSIKATDVTSIKIARPNEGLVELVRAGDHWQMTAPLKIAADQYLVQALLSDINEHADTGFPVKDADLGKYGFAPAHARLWLNGTELDFGDTEPINNYRYVISGSSVRLSSGLLYYRLNHDPMWWVDKRLLPAGGRIDALQLPHATLSLKNGKWQLTPADPAVSADAIQQLVDNWSDARALSVAELGKGKPQGEVAIQVQGQSAPLRFVILKDPDFLVLARPDLGLQYNLESTQRGALLELQTPRKAAAAAPVKPVVLSTPGNRPTMTDKDGAHARTAGSGNRTPRD